MYVVNVCGLQCFECDLPVFAYATGCSHAIHLFLKDRECKYRWEEYHAFMSRVISFIIIMNK